MQFPTFHLGQLLFRQPCFLGVLWEVATNKGLDPQHILPTPIEEQLWEELNWLHTSDS